MLGELTIEGQVLHVDGKFGFAFIVTGECGNPDCTAPDQKHVYASKVPFDTEEEAEAMLQHAVQHFVMTFKRNIEESLGKTVEATGINFGEIPVDFSGEVH